MGKLAAKSRNEHLVDDIFRTVKCESGSNTERVEVARGKVEYMRLGKIAMIYGLLNLYIWETGTPTLTLMFTPKGKSVII